LLKIIKTLLKEVKSIWSDELPSVLWVYRMTTRTLIGETPFQPAYRSEVVIPTKVGLTSYRVKNHDENRNDKAMRLQLNLIYKVRATAA